MCWIFNIFKCFSNVQGKLILKKLIKEREDDNSWHLTHCPSRDKYLMVNRYLLELFTNKISWKTQWYLSNKVFNFFKFCNNFDIMNPDNFITYSRKGIKFCFHSNYLVTAIFTKKISIHDLLSNLTSLSIVCFNWKHSRAN